MNHIHQLALHRPRRSLQQRKNKQPISTKLRTAPHIQQFRNHAILSLANKRRRYSRTDQTLTLNLANRTKQAWPNKLGMRKGPDLLDLGEGELEGGIDPVQDLAPPHEVGAVHDPDARVLDNTAIASFPLSRELQNKLFVAIVEIEQLHEVVRDAVGGR